MRSGLVARARGYAVDAAGAVQRAPVEVSLAVALAIALSYAIEAGGLAMRAWSEIAITAALMAATAWIATLLSALERWSPATRWTITIAGALAAGAYGLFVLDLELRSEAWRAAALIAAAVLLVIASPALAAQGDARSTRLRVVNGRFVVRLIGVLIYALALFAGLALALASVDVLFELNLAGTIYGHVFGWIFLVLVPWVVLGGVNAYAARNTPADDVSGVLHRMSGFLVPPLLAIYFAILFAYVIRIAVTGEVPKNLISPMVIAAGLLAAIALLLFDPRPEPRSAYRWLRITPILFLPLAALGVWAVLQRLDQYGWTEFRALRIVLLLALALLALLATVEFARRRRLSLHVAPLTLAVVLLLAAVGPWNVQAVAKRSQQQHLAEALRSAGVVAATPSPDPPEEIEVDRQLYEDIRSKAAYLASHFGTAALPAVLARHATAGQDYHNLAAAAGLRMRATEADREHVAFGRLSEGAGVGGDGEAEYYRIAVMADRAPPIGDARRPITAVQDDLTLRVRAGGRSLAAPLDGLEHRLRGSVEPRGVALTDDAVLGVFDAAGREAGRLIVLEITADWRAGRFRIQRLDGLLVLSPR